jgi:hypothetical protein
VRTATHLFNCGFGGADEARNLGVLQFRMIADKPENGVRAVLTLGQWCIAGTLTLGFGNADLGVRQFQPMIDVTFALGNFFTRQLAGRNRIKTLDALRRIAKERAVLSTSQTAVAFGISNCVDINNILSLARLSRGGRWSDHRLMGIGVRNNPVRDNSQGRAQSARINPF